MPSKCGYIKRCQIANVLIGKGQEKAASATTSIIERIRPTYILLVGIAGGFPAKGVRRGDVAIAHTIHSFDFGKLEGNSFKRRPELDFICDRGLLALAEVVATAEERGWRNNVVDGRPDGMPSDSFKVHTDCYVASSNKVVDNPAHDFYSKVAELFPEIHCVEMEGVGAGQSIQLAHVESVTKLLMIRGISDEPGQPEEGKDQREKWKNYAISTAANFTRTLIEQLVDDEAPQSSPGRPGGNNLKKIFISKLPNTGEFLLGRSTQLKKLERYKASLKAKIVSVIAAGGEGKTALVSQWLGEQLNTNSDEFEYIYAWSFYSQGIRTDTSVSSDDFFERFSSWLDIDGVANLSPWAKAEKIAETMASKKILLILDGLETLQSSNYSKLGEIQDRNIRHLLVQMAVSNLGFCIITSRVRLSDLDKWTNKSVYQIKLLKLPEKASISLLRRLGVVGQEHLLREVARSVDCHALAVNLLGNWLREAWDGDVRHSRELPTLQEHNTRVSKHAERVMLAYKIWFSRSNSRNELLLLMLIGLFDRPSKIDFLEALYKPDPINGLTESLNELSSAQIKQIITRLSDIGLIFMADDNALDAHPIIRSWADQELKRFYPGPYLEANRRISSVLSGLVVQQPSNSSDINVLYRAFQHACKANLHEQAFKEILWERIYRGQTYYSLLSLGLWGSDLAAIACLFEVPYTKPLSFLSTSNQAGFLGIAGLDLRSLGRLKEAVRTMEAGLKIHKNIHEHANSARATGNIAELQILVCDFKNALASAISSVRYASACAEHDLECAGWSYLGQIFHYTNIIKKAFSAFRRAEIIQQRIDGKILNGTIGFRFCQLLLAKGMFDDVISRASISMEQNRYNNLHIGLSKITIGQAYIGRDPCTPTVSDIVDEAIDSGLGLLFSVKAQDYLPHGLLASSARHRWKRNFCEAVKNVDEVLYLSQEREMKIFEIDAYYELSKIYKADMNYSKSQYYFMKANKLSSKYNYHIMSAVNRQPPDES